MSVVASVALVLAVAGLLAATIPALLGYHQVTVYGGSMGNSLPAGSIALTRTVDPAGLEVGDVIVARGSAEGGLPVLHRIIAIEDEDGRRMATLKGDANETPDPDPIVLGSQGDRLVFHVPWIGYALDRVRTREGTALLLGGALATWLISEGVSAWRLYGRRLSVVGSV